MSRRVRMIRILRQYIEDGFSDLGDFRNCRAYGIEEEAAEIELDIRGIHFIFYIEPGSYDDSNKACGLLAVTDSVHDGPKVKGPIDPTTWAGISAFVRARIAIKTVATEAERLRLE